MPITPKKRYQILERDWFSCKYCGRKPPFVMLEVDHIIPKSKGGGDAVDNLLTTCFECNRGKAWKLKWESKKNIYRSKLNDTGYKALQFFFEEWNRLKMGTIDWKTLSFVQMQVTMFASGNDYTSFLDFPPLRPNKDFPDYEIADNMFKLWGVFCDEVLGYMLHNEKEGISSMLEYCFDDENWKPTEKANYSSRLNYYLTEDNIDWYETIGKLYILKKFTLFPNLLDNG